METVIRKKMVEVNDTVYIACDGKEFTNQYECKEHEKDIKMQKVCEIVSPLPHTVVCPTDWDDDFSCNWYLVNTPEELEAIKLKFFMYDAYANEFQPKAYPVMVRVVANDQGYGNIEDYFTILHDAQNYFFELQGMAMEYGLKYTNTEEVKE